MTVARRALVTATVLTVAGLASAMIGHGRRQLALERPIQAVTGGVQRAFSATGRGIGDTVRSVRELQEIRGEYEALLERLDEAERVASRIETLERENRLLREQLGFAARLSLPVVPARVIARDQHALFDSMTINRGTRHDVAVGYTVVAFSGGRQGVVGRVIEASGGTSLIRPISSPLSYIAARLDRSRIEGLLEGDGAAEDLLTLRFVPRDARNELGYGDLVVTSGLDSIFPGDLAIGTVDRVSAPAYESTLVVRVAPIVDLSRLEYVFVVRRAVGTAGDR